MNESSQEMEFNLDSSHSAEDEKKLENENQFPESLRPYFELVHKDPEHSIAQCLLCVKKKAINSKYKGFKNSLSNWESCKHSKECRKYREAKVEEAVKKANDCDRFCPSTSKSRATTGKSQPKITEHFRSNSKRNYSKQHPKQRQITKLPLKSVTCASLPLSIVDKPSFCELIEELNEKYAIPHRQTIKETHLPFEEKLIVNSITIEMKDSTSVYVTVDIWTNRQMRSFIGFTAHFVDNDFDLKSRLLCCKHFVERQNAVNIANRYEDVVMRYQIDRKVRRIISDNASLMKKAFELSLIDMKALEQEAAEMKSDEDLHFSDKRNHQDPEVDLNTLLALLPKRVSCFAHTMPLCIVLALENIKGKLPGDQKINYRSDWGSTLRLLKNRRLPEHYGPVQQQANFFIRRMFTY